MWNHILTDIRNTRRQCNKKLHTTLRNWICRTFLHTFIPFLERVSEWEEYSGCSIRGMKSFTNRDWGEPLRCKAPAPFPWASTRQYSWPIRTRKKRASFPRCPSYKTRPAATWCHHRGHSSAGDQGTCSYVAQPTRRNLKALQWIVNYCTGTINLVPIITYSNTQFHYK